MPLGPAYGDIGFSEVTDSPLVVGRIITANVGEVVTDNQGNVLINNPPDFDC